MKNKNIIEDSFIGVCWILTISMISFFVFNNSPASAKELDASWFLDTNTNSTTNINENISNNISDFSPTIIANRPPSQITLVRTKTKTVETIDIETYIAGVVAEEVPNNFELEALKAQAVAARGITFSRVMNKSKHPQYNNADVCDNPSCCQAYNPNNINDAIKQAVSETKGLVPILAGEYAPTLYFASTLGGTLTDEHVWGSKTKSTSMFRELNGPSPESKILSTAINKYPYAHASVTMSISSFVKKVNSVYPNANLTNGNVRDNVKVISRTKGDYVDKFKIGNVTISGSDVRYKLFTQLKSANFSISFSDSDITFTTKGYGHGVGMSQWGANALAKEGKNFREILDYYFQNISIEQVY